MLFVHVHMPKYILGLVELYNQILGQGTASVVDFGPGDSQCLTVVLQPGL